MTCLPIVPPWRLWDCPNESNHVKPVTDGSWDDLNERLKQYFDHYVKP